MLSTILENRCSIHMTKQNFIHGENSLGWMLHMTLKSMKLLFGKNFSEGAIDLSAEQFLVLKIVAEHEDMIAQDFCEIFRVDKSAVQRKIDHLQDRRLLAKIPDSKDRRRKVLAITKQGLEQLQQARPILEKSFAQLTQGISEEELRQLAKVLHTIQNNVSQTIG